MAFCPICSDLLLRHIHSRHSYFYCQSCRLEISEAVEAAQKVAELSQSKTKSKAEVFLAQAIRPANLASIEILAEQTTRSA